MTAETLPVPATASGGHQPGNESYSFDLNGNRDGAGQTTGADNLASSDGTFNYQYDADGNRTVRTRIATAYASDYRTTYTCDYRNRLTDVDDYDNNGALTKHVHYVYDVFNNLIGEEDDDSGDDTYDEQQWYVVEGGRPVLQFDGAGDLTARYFGNAQEEVSSLNQGGTVYWMAVDNEGTVRDVVDGNGDLLDNIVYTAFGQTAYESSPSTPHLAGYAGEYLSPGTSLILSGARWYDASTGGWLSTDPIGFVGGDANLQRYVGNDPTDLVDPSGLSGATPQKNVTVTQYIYATAAFGGEGLHGEWSGNGVSWRQDLTWFPGKAPGGGFTQWTATYRAGASGGSRLDDYANWFREHVPGANWWMHKMGGNIEGMLGDDYLAGASDGELLDITAIAATAGVAGGIVGAGVAGAAGFARIIHRPGTDFVRSRGVVASYGQNSHEFCYAVCAASTGAGE